MKAGKLISGLVLLAAILWITFKSGVFQPDHTSSSASTTNERLREELTLRSKVSFRSGESDADTLYILEAFENRDEEELRRRVRELLERDFEGALRVFAKLDYTLNHYNMIFPHDVVSDYLEEHYDENEVMEIMGAYLNTSSILCSVTGVYFNKWLTRDHQGQFKWLRENSSFGEIRILAGYAEAVGQFDKSAEILQLIDTLPAEDSRKEELHGAVMNFVSGDNPQAFAEYLNSLDQLPKEAMAPIYNLATQIIRNSEPDRAMQEAQEWIDLIKEPREKERYLSLIAANFSFEHPEKFDEWFSAQEFSSEAEKEVMKTKIAEQLDFLQHINSEESLEARKRLEQESPFSN